jgi:nitrite reductase (NO-forming)
MVTETEPRRTQVTIETNGTTNSTAERSTGVKYRQTGSGGPPTNVALPLVGPSWREFLFVQISLVAAAALLFGIIGFALVSRATPAGTGGTTPAPSAAASMPPDMAHGGAVAPAAAGSVARLPLPQVAPPVGQREPTTVKYAVEVKEIVATLDDGVTYTYWTFGGTVPGPMLRVRVGDQVELTLTNNATSVVQHNIDLHAVTGPGGGAEATMVAPGESKTFRFQALNPGVYVYHCAVPPVAHHIASGMYGLIVVEPKGGLPKVDHEFYVMQGEFYLEGNRGDKGFRNFSTEKMLAEQPEYVVFNGSVGALTGDNALKAKVGETVRIFFGVGGPNITSSFHVIGEIFDRVAVEGGAYEDPSRWLTNVQTTGVPSGGATTVEFKVEVPGKYVLVDHSLGRAIKGAVGILMVEGPENPDVFLPQP